MNPDELNNEQRDVLITRVIDGVASNQDWTTFRQIAADDPSIWNQLSDTQQIHESVSAHLERAISCADHIELPGGVINEQQMNARLDLISRWGGWAAAAAILIAWFFGKPAALTTQEETSPIIAGATGMGLLLDQARPDQAFGQYLSSGQRSGQVVGEMPEHIVIETRPMQDGTIEVLYLRQIIERQIIDHAYRETHDEAGNVIPVPVRLSPFTDRPY